MSDMCCQPYPLQASRSLFSSQMRTKKTDHMPFGRSPNLRTNCPTKSSRGLRPFPRSTNNLLNSIIYIYIRILCLEIDTRCIIQKSIDCINSGTDARKIEAVCDKVSDTSPRHPSSDHWLELLGTAALQE